MEGLFGKYRVLLAPMAGVSDIAFRTLCREAGADMAFTEMVSAKGLSFANEKTRHLLALAGGESQVAVQLFGHEPEVMASQAAWIEDEMGESLAYLDINMGCPARKIVSKGDGSALMKEPDLAASVVRAVKGVVEHPVTVKFRRGWAEGDETAPAFARRMEEAGADGVTVHGRFAEQLYRGSADWGVIARARRGQRRHPQRSRRHAHGGRDRLRRGDDRPGRRGQPMAVLPGSGRSCRRTRTCAAHG